MIANYLTKALTLRNYKIFINMIGHEDQEECLTSMQLEKDQRDIFLLAEAE